MSEFTEETASRRRELRQRTEERTNKPDSSLERSGWVTGLHATSGNRSVSRVLSGAAPLGGMRISPGLNSPVASRMIYRLAADSALAQRTGEMAEEEELQAKHTDVAIAQREEVPDEEELMAKHTDAAIAQRTGEMAEGEELQAKHTDVAIAQREGAPEEEELLQGKHEPGAVLGAEGGTLDDMAAQRIESLRGGGSSLSPDIQAKMEGHFGADFSGVRVHQDSESDSLAAGMSARAFTTGSDVFLRQSERAGDATLMAHELTHVVQQSSGIASGTQGSGLSVGASNDPLEAEADREAALLNAGAPARLVAEDAEHQH